MSQFYTPKKNPVYVSSCHRGLKRPLTPDEIKADQKAMDNFKKFAFEQTNKK